MHGEDGLLRPDMTICLPRERTIVIDAFVDSLEVNDEQQRIRCLQKHVQNTENQIRVLSAKQYQNQFERSPDFVVLFIPGESSFHAAMQINLVS